MMDDIMNADLERDGGSEADEASTVGSSAGTIYCTLEDDFSKITNEMKTNEALAPYEAQYTRLYEALYSAFRLEEQLTQKCSNLQTELTESKNKISSLERKLELSEDSIKELKREIVDNKKLADAAHTREQKSQEHIQNLKVSIAKLNEELEQKNKQLAHEENTTGGGNKKKDNLAKERERLLDENRTLRQRLKTLSAYNEEAQSKLVETEKQLSDLQKRYDRQTGELAQESRGRESIESELREVYDELEMRILDIQTADRALKTSAENAQRQANQLREQATATERHEKELRKLNSKLLSCKAETQRDKGKLEECKKIINDKNKRVAELERQCGKVTDQLSKAKSELERAEKRSAKQVDEMARVEDESSRLQSELKKSESALTDCQRQLVAERRTVEKLSREKEQALVKVANCQETYQRSMQEAKFCQQTIAKSEQSLQEALGKIDKLERQIVCLEKERDRERFEAQRLSEKLDDLADEIKLKQSEIGDCQKKLSEAEGAKRKNLALLEEARSECNTYKTNLNEAKSEIGKLRLDLSDANGKLSETVDELRDCQAQLAKMEFVLGNLEKERESLENELQNSEQRVSSLRREIGEKQQEEKRLRNFLRDADNAIVKQKKDIESITNERDVIGAQIVRRNDELSLQYNKMRLLRIALDNGEKEFGKKTEENRALKLSLNELQFDKDASVKSTARLAELRGELFNLERQLTMERLKVTALEEEMQNPLNFHRWRKLEGTDPENFELVRKVNLLQKRILKMSSEIISKEKKVKEAERMYENLREAVSKQPGPEIVTRLNRTRSALRNRSKKMKCLVAELNMTLTSEHKFEIEKMRKELNALKVKCFVQKKNREEKTAATTTTTTTTTKENRNEKDPLCDGRKIESGFALTSTRSKAATPLQPINK